MIEPPFESEAGYRSLAEEMMIVLALSLLPNAVYALINLLEVPVPGSTAALFDQQVSTTNPWEVVREFLPAIFDLAPVALVFHLARRDGEGLAPFGLGAAGILRDLRPGIAAGLGLAAAASLAYLVSFRLGLHRFVIPVPPPGRSWTVPLLVVGAVSTSMLEEVIMAGYLLHRLEQLRWSVPLAVGATSVFRGVYHLYQGPGGMLGNLVLGGIIGWAFYRWRRTWPLVAAHATLDIAAGLAFMAVQGRCLLSVCFPS
ncbi:MAG: CPBP family intramembrane glutamic endopeptidase [Actinomycetota bacterium]